MAENSGGEYRADTPDSTRRFHENLIRAAKAGDRDKAWLLVQLIVDELDGVERGNPLLSYAADFFDHLFRLKSELAPQMLSKRDASHALDALNLFASPKRPNTGDSIILAKLACEEQLRRKDRPASVARDEVAKSGISSVRLRDRRTERPDLVKLVEMATDAELEVLAAGGV